MGRSEDFFNTLRVCGALVTSSKPGSPCSSVVRGRFECLWPADLGLVNDLLRRVAHEVEHHIHRHAVQGCEASRLVRPWHQPSAVLSPEAAKPARRVGTPASTAAPDAVTSAPNLRRADAWLPLSHLLSCLPASAELSTDLCDISMCEGVLREVVETSEYVLAKQYSVAYTSQNFTTGTA